MGCSVHTGHGLQLGKAGTLIKGERNSNVMSQSSSTTPIPRDQLPSVYGNRKPLPLGSAHIKGSESREEVMPASRSLTATRGRRHY